MDDPKTTPPDKPDWGERRRRPEPPRRDHARPEPPPETSREPRPSDPPPPHGDPLQDELHPGSGEDWSARHGAPPPPRSGLDFSALFVLLDALRRAAPAELQERVTAFIREGLLTLRSLIDWYLERLERPSREPKVEEIKID
jgi:hypothetical protein